MPNDTKPRELFNRAHYNILAKEIREHFPIEQVGLTGWEAEFQHKIDMTEQAILSTLALSLCKRFKEDNPCFDPIKFLEACSPDNNLYPLSELYDGD